MQIPKPISFEIIQQATYGIESFVLIVGWTDGNSTAHQRMSREGALSQWKQLLAKYY